MIYRAVPLTPEIILILSTQSIAQITDIYRAVAQLILIYCEMFSTGTLWNTRILSHIINKHTNSTRKFPGDFEISSRFPGVLDTLKYLTCAQKLISLPYNVAPHPADKGTKTVLEAQNTNRRVMINTACPNVTTERLQHLWWPSGMALVTLTNGAVRTTAVVLWGLLK